MDFTVRCTVCDHSALLGDDILAPRLDDPPSLRNIHRIYGKLSCSRCSNRAVALYGSDGVLLIDPAQTRRCAACGDPIIIPRQQAAPSGLLCLECAEQGEAPRTFAPYPMPPADLSRCPRCESPTIVRENSATGDYFIGCTSFPKCRWTAEMPEAG